MDNRIVLDVNYLASVYFFILLILCDLFRVPDRDLFRVPDCDLVRVPDRVPDRDLFRAPACSHS